MFKYVIIKPTTSCNFNCSFCSAKLLNIPFHKTVPNVLKEYLLDYKPDSLIITGGEPLVNTKEYFDELVSIMEQITPNYSISLTSNVVLWNNNPEKYDYLFNNEHIGVITSFQYGGERKDEKDYSEERFIDLFNKFYNRYKIKLKFIYVVNEHNEQYALRACELARRLGTKLKLNQCLPLGLSKDFYPRYKLLELYLKVIDAGYAEQLENLASLNRHSCPFPISSQLCKYGRVVYVDANNQLQVNNCEDIISSRDNIQIDNSALFKDCYKCKMFSLCNSCSVNKHYTENIKETNCKWMKEHYNILLEKGLII